MVWFDSDNCDEHSYVAVIIVSVNDMRDIYDMRSQIAKADITSFEFLVRERDECPVGGGDSSDGPPLPRTSKHVQFIDEADMVVS